MYCANCKKQLDEGDKFCSNCGGTVADIGTKIETSFSNTGEASIIQYRRVIPRNEKEREILERIIKDNKMYDCLIINNTESYTTMKYKNYDIIRIKYTDKSKWISIFLTKEDKKSNKDNPLFKNQKNKNQLLWKSLMENDISVYYQFIINTYNHLQNNSDLT